MKLQAWSMEERALTLAGLLGLCVPLLAQPTDGPRFFSGLNSSSLSIPSLTLADAQFFSFSTGFNRLETSTPDFLPTALPTTPSQRAVAYAKPVADPKDFKDASDMARHNLLDYVHGEIGFLYGRGTGRFGGAVEAGYIIGEVGDDKFNITAGASYEHSSGRFPRFGR